jgi:hypothetical protein
MLRGGGPPGPVLSMRGGRLRRCPRPASSPACTSRRVNAAANRCWLARRCLAHRATRSRSGTPRSGVGCGRGWCSTTQTPRTVPMRSSPGLPRVGASCCCPPCTPLPAVRHCHLLQPRQARPLAGLRHECSTSREQQVSSRAAVDIPPPHHCTDEEEDDEGADRRRSSAEPGSRHGSRLGQHDHSSGSRDPGHHQQHSHRHASSSSSAGNKEHQQHSTHSVSHSDSQHPQHDPSSSSEQPAAQQHGDSGPGNKGGGGKMQWLTRSDLDGLQRKPRSLLEDVIADASVDVPEVTQVGREQPAAKPVLAAHSTWKAKATAAACNSAAAFEPVAAALLCCCRCAGCHGRPAGCQLQMTSCCGSGALRAGSCWARSATMAAPASTCPWTQPTGWCWWQQPTALCTSTTSRTPSRWVGGCGKASACSGAAAAGSRGWRPRDAVLVVIRFFELACAPCCTPGRSSRISLPAGT